MIRFATMLLIAAVCGGCGFQEAERDNQTEVVDPLEKMRSDLDRLIEITAVLAAQLEQQQNYTKEAWRVIRELRERLRNDYERQQQWQRRYEQERYRLYREQQLRDRAGGAGDGRRR